MKTRTLIIITGIIISSALLISFFSIQNYSEPFRESTLELRFEKEIITVLIRDETNIATNFTELTTIPISNLVKAHDKLPKTSSQDRIIAGSIVSETEKSGTYLTEEGFKEFWYTIDDGNDYGIIIVELQNHEFDRMVFDSENSQELIDQINEIVSNSKQVPKVTRDSEKFSKSIIDVGNDIFPKDIDEYTFARGNPQSDIVLVYAQGGPLSLLDSKGLSLIYDSGMRSKLKDALFVNVHQAQTLMPELFDENSISFDQAKQHDAKTTQMLYKVIKYFKDDGKTVYVVGISFGAFVVQDLLATNGNISDGYLIMVGRLNIQDEIWTSYSKGIVMEFDDDALTPIMADDIGHDHDGFENMHKLAAGLGHKRYVELLEDVNLSNVVYVYGEKDKMVGKLSDLELEFLHSHNATVLKSQNDHLDAVYEKLDEGILKMTDTLN